MPTTTFKKEEMVAFGELRSLNQKQLLHSLDENDKLGIVIKDKLSAVVLDMKKYEAMVAAIESYEKLQERLEEQELFQELNLKQRLETDRDQWERVPADASLFDWLDTRKAE
ncbi:hypothetical protein QWJ34_00095 [Saccharibacillus sp. CPCC 101409]|uniref:hypothetical protein n=1 Tax=Saccharibacillus sp. CPCC 101409 TaxID=3058041 RepID=UPI002671E21F|nr:hypothetical protein [Saccharibacillus sp. CPCC 101409]MDO3408156.1 hypothetical protein [Saccharibacillus sp. CPCC 101409]